MLSEEKVREMLERLISDFDKVIEKIDAHDDGFDVETYNVNEHIVNHDDDFVVEMYDVAEQLEGAIDALKEVLEIKA